METVNAFWRSGYPKKEYLSTKVDIPTSYLHRPRLESEIDGLGTPPALYLSSREE